MVLLWLKELQIEWETDGWEIRTAPSRENMILWKGSGECLGKGEVREGFLEEMGFKDGMISIDRNAGPRVCQAPLKEYRKGKGQVVGFSGARSAVWTQEEGSWCRHLEDEGLVCLECVLHCFSLAGYCF